MKLKPIVASLMLLGLAAPAFADDSATQAQLDQMKAQINKMQAVINQNGSAANQLAQPADWMSRITISGLLNVDGTYGSRSPVTYQSGAVSNLAINNANLLIDAAVNDWTNVHANLAYRNNVSSVLSPVVSATSRENDVNFDEAYVTIGNFAQSPIYLRAGREFVPFGVYDLYPMVVNPTQALTQTQATAAQVGFVSPVGVYGSVYGFRGVAQTGDVSNVTVPGGQSLVVTTRPNVRNFGFNLGWAQCTDAWGVKLDAGWLRNIYDTDAVQIFAPLTYSHVASAVSLHAGFNMQQFDVKGDYVDVLDSMNTQLGTFTESTKPRVLGVEAGYSFPVVNNHASRLAVGYQKTKDLGAMEVLLPKDRWYGDYNVNVSKWTDVGFEVYRDRSVDSDNATVGVVRLGVKFA